MATFLGQFPKVVDRSTTEWAVLIVEQFGQIDGGHHKAWVLDQVARVLHGAPVEVVEARWDSGRTEERWTVGTSPAYEAWRQRMEGDEYDAGVAP